MEMMISPLPPSTSDVAWGPGPSHPRLTEGAVHVWRADLESVADDVLDVLSCDEHRRSRRILDRHGGRRWARSRGVLRILLGRYCGEDPRKLHFILNPHGKPVLVEPRVASGFKGPPLQASCPIFFNLSHSHQVALYAFSDTAPVGIDVEVETRRIDELSLARRLFDSETTRALAMLHPTARRREFLRVWTRFEAERKCRGTGIAVQERMTRRPRPWIADLAIAPEVAAIAVARSPNGVLCWGWP